MRNFFSCMCSVCNVFVCSYIWTFVCSHMWARWIETSFFLTLYSSTDIRANQHIQYQYIKSPSRVNIRTYRGDGASGWQKVQMVGLRMAEGADGRRWRWWASRWQEMVGLKMVEGDSDGVHEDGRKQRWWTSEKKSRSWKTRHENCSWM